MRGEAEGDRDRDREIGVSKRLYPITWFHLNSHIHTHTHHMGWDDFHAIQRFHCIPCSDIENVLFVFHSIYLTLTWIDLSDRWILYQVTQWTVDTKTTKIDTHLGDSCILYIWWWCVGSCDAHETNKNLFTIRREVSLSITYRKM